MRRLGGKFQMPLAKDCVKQLNLLRLGWKVALNLLSKDAAGKLLMLDFSMHPVVDSA